MIGVFDSGSGGLTVLTALQNALPDRDFIYLGDHANSPYGNKGPEAIHNATLKGVDYLFQSGAKIVLLACNTASAVSLRRIQEDWLQYNHPDKRVLGVLIPMVEALTGLTWDRDNPGISPEPAKSIAVFGTARTVESGAYSYEVARRSPQSKVFQKACPDLAGAIEDNADKRDLRKLVKGYCDDLLFQANGSGIDAAILACTHFPLVEDLFKDALPDDVQIMSQPIETAMALKKYLERHPEFDSKSGGQTKYLTTGHADQLPKLSAIQIPTATDFQSIKI